MKKTILFILTLVLSLSLFACSSSKEDGAAEGLPQTEGETAEGSYKKITAQEAKKMMDDGGVTVVDVRTAQEYAEGHIDGALLIPNETISDTPPELLKDKAAVILIYCRSGNRSRQAAEKLAAMGYTSVFDFGGIGDWEYGTVTGEFQAS